MKIVHISDTHSKHNNLNIPENIDLLIFSGDWSRIGSSSDTENFFNWLISLNIPKIVFIAGNHERTLDNDWIKNSHRTNSLVKKEIYKVKKLIKSLPNNITYLYEESINYMGYNIYGTPWSNMFPAPYMWGFNWLTVNAEKESCYKIPKNTNILITHSPPFGILDYVNTIHAGSNYLKEKILNNLPNLKLHCFGHLHQENNSDLNFNIEKINNCLFSNGSVLNHNYEQVVYFPKIITLPDIN